MTQKAIRAGFFVEKRKLSKYETTIESAFKQKRVYTMALDEQAVLTYVPDTVILIDGDNSGSPTLTLPGTVFDEDKQVVVVNKDAAETLEAGTAAQVAATGITCPAASVTVLYYDGSEWALLYTQTGVATT